MGGHSEAKRLRNFLTTSCSDQISSSGHLLTVALRSGVNVEETIDVSLHGVVLMAPGNASVDSMQLLLGFKLVAHDGLNCADNSIEWPVGSDWSTIMEEQEIVALSEPAEEYGAPWSDSRSVAGALSVAESSLCYSVDTASSSRAQSQAADARGVNAKGARLKHCEARGKAVAAIAEVATQSTTVSVVDAVVQTESQNARARPPASPRLPPADVRNPTSGRSSDAPTKSSRHRSSAQRSRSSRCSKDGEYEHVLPCPHFKTTHSAAVEFGLREVLCHFNVETRASQCCQWHAVATRVVSFLPATKCSSTFSCCADWQCVECRAVNAIGHSMCAICGADPP